MINSLLIDIGIIILFSALVAIITKILRQPIVLGYLIAGLLIGPLAFKLITNTELIKQLAELGVAFLLFIVGLELDINKFKQLGWVVSITTVLQVALVTIVAAFFASIWLNKLEAMYIGLIVAFSSTMIVVKLLEDKGEMQTLHGKIILGILLVQDILVVLALSLLKNLQTTSTGAIIGLLQGVALIIISYLIGKYLFEYILKFTASTPELLFITALAIAFTYATLAYFIGFSIAIGAFIAGIALASSPYSVEIVGRVTSLKDFFLVIFFTSLGMQISNINIGSNISLLIIILLLVLILKPLIIFGLLKMFKQSNRTSFSTAISLAQVSEFSLVMAGMGVTLGHITANTFTIILITGAITITLTSYLIKYDRTIYTKIQPIIQVIETNPKNFNIESIDKKLENHIIVIGAHRMATPIIEILKNKKKQFIVIDFNPDRVKQLQKEKVNCIYGDYGNIHVLESVGIEKAKTIISTVPNLDDNLRMIKIVKDHNKTAVIITASSKAMDSLMLYRDGADFVVFPEYITGQKIADYMIHLDNKGIKRWGQGYRTKLIDEIRKNRLFM